MKALSLQEVFDRKSLDELQSLKDEIQPSELWGTSDYLRLFLIERIDQEIKKRLGDE